MKRAGMVLFASVALGTCAGCAQRTVDFTCEIAGSAVMRVGKTEYKLPATISFTGSRDDLMIELPTPAGKTVRAKAEIQFSSDYKPTDVDRYARLRAVFTRELITTVEEGGAAIFTGYSASKQQVFRLLFGKE